MLTTIEGVFKEGRVELRETPPGVEHARVIVTFLPEEGESTSASPASRRLLDLLRSWQAEPLSPEEDRVLAELEEFQTAHPLRLARFEGGP